MDLLLFDKVTRNAIPLQIKSRRTYDDARAKTVQFDVRLKTFAGEGEGYLLCVKLDGAAIEMLWLIPAAELSRVARKSSSHLIVMPSAKPASRDRLTPYRAGHSARSPPASSRAKGPDKSFPDPAQKFPVPVAKIPCS